jgi:hypothetical protein
VLVREYGLALLHHNDVGPSTRTRAETSAAAGSSGDVPSSTCGVSAASVFTAPSTSRDGRRRDVGVIVALKIETDSNGTVAAHFPNA